jgi:hypothetical protein
METNIIPSQYYNHPYNDTKNCERAVELPLGFNYLNWVTTQGRVACEIGAVTPYYQPAAHEVIDPYDDHANKKAMVEGCDFKGKDVLSISTFEHFGFGDYGFPVVQNQAIEQLRKIVDECLTCLITWPIGYNKGFDDQVRDSCFSYFFYEKISDNPKTWRKTTDKGCFNYKYGPRGNCIICVYKGFV